MPQTKQKPEERVNLAINMTDVCLRICAEGIRNRNPTISEEQVIESLRERIRYMKKLELEG